MSSKDLSSQAFSFKYQEFFKPGFIWYRDEAVAFVKEHYTVQLLIPSELLRQYPHYSASYNGFIEIPAGFVWFAPKFVAEIVRAWGHRFFGAPFEQSAFEKAQQSLRTLFGFHTGYPDLHKKMHNATASQKKIQPARQPLLDSFREIALSTKGLFPNLYELIPLWSNHVTPIKNEEKKRSANLRVLYKSNKLIPVQTSLNLVLSEGLVECASPSTLLGFCVRKLSLTGEILDYWFIAPYKLGYDSFTSQVTHYQVDCEMSQKLSNREEGQVKAREVDQKLDEIAWSKDPTLNLEELEKIAMVMTSMETPNQSLQYKRHVLYDLFVDEKPLTEILDKIEASGDSPYSKNINPKLFSEACAARAVELNGTNTDLPLSPFFALRPNA